eukprot:3962262-Heterocapsa_arctica.AAC.1
MEDRENKRIKASPSVSQEGVKGAEERLNPRHIARVREEVDTIEGAIVRTQARAKAAELSWL